MAITVKSDHAFSKVTIRQSNMVKIGLCSIICCQIVNKTWNRPIHDGRM